MPNHRYELDLGKATITRVRRGTVFVIDFDGVLLLPLDKSRQLSPDLVHLLDGIDARLRAGQTPVADHAHLSMMFSFNPEEKPNG